MSEFTIKGRKYHLVFTNAALQEVTKKFGGLTEMGAKLKEDAAEAMDHLFWLFALLANQGTMLDTGNTSKSNPDLIDADYVALHTRPRDMQKISEVITAAEQEGMTMEYQDDDSGGIVDIALKKLDEEESKNVVGGAD